MTTSERQTMSTSSETHVRADVLARTADMHEAAGRIALARVSRLSPRQAHYALVHLAGTGEGNDELRRALDFAESVND